MFCGKASRLFKSTPLALLLSAPLAHAELALPDRPPIPAAVSFLPAPPQYIQPDLLPYSSPMPEMPIFPTAPIKTYPEYAPPLTEVFLPGVSTTWILGVTRVVEASKDEAISAINAAFEQLPLFAESDFYAPQLANRTALDVYLGGGVMEPHFTYIDSASKYAKFSLASHGISIDLLKNIASVLRGEPVLINGEQVDSIWLSGNGTNGYLYSKNGALVVIGSQIHSQEPEQQSLRLGIDQYLAEYDQGVRSDELMSVMAIDTTSPNYSEYESAVQQYAGEMNAFNLAYADYISAKNNYDFLVAEYQAWHAENADVISHNQNLLWAADAAYQAAIIGYAAAKEEAIILRLDSLPSLAAMGGGYAPGVAASAFGPAAIAAGDRSTAVGVDAFAVGESSVAIGDNAVSVGRGSFAAGQNSLAYNDNAIAIGSGALAIGGVAIGAGAVSETDISIAIGAGARAVSSVAIGVGSQALGLNTTALGDWSSAVGDLSFAAGANALAVGINSVALGSGTVALRDNSVSVGGRVITDVARPIEDSDAATKGYVDEQISAVIAPDLTHVESRLGALDKKIDRIEKRAAAGTAIALALQTPTALLPGERGLGVGIGVYGGQQAIAISYAHNLNLPKEWTDKRWYKELLLSAGVGTTESGRVGARAGAMFKF